MVDTSIPPRPRRSLEELINRSQAAKAKPEKARELLDRILPPPVVDPVG